MDPISDEVLFANLYEIYLAQTQGYDCGPDGEGGSLHHPRSVVGRLYGPYHWWTGNQALLKGQAFKITGEAFQRFSSSIVDYNKEGISANLSENGRMVSQWYNRFWRVMSKPRHYGLQKICEVIGQAVPSIAQIKAVHKKLPLARLQSNLAEAIPVQTLQKVARGEKLEMEGREDIRRFLMGINRAGELLTVRDVHRGLALLVESWQDNKADLRRLEFFLYREGCPIFCEVDEKHVVRRDRLGPGSKVTSQEKVYTLRREIVPGIPRSESCDLNKVYEVEEDAGRVYIVSGNEALLPLKNYAVEQEGHGVPVRGFLGFDDQGLGGFYERLTLLTKIQWQSKKGRLTEGDKMRADPIVHLILGMLADDVLLEPMDPKRLGLTHDNRVRGLTKFGLKPFSYRELEAFVREVAQGNATVYRFLVTASGLTHELGSQFFRRAVEKTLAGEAFSLEALSHESLITEYSVFMEAEQLIKDLRKLVEKCMTALGEEGQLKKKVHALIRREIEIRKDVFWIKNCKASVLIDRLRPSKHSDRSVTACDAVPPK